MSDSYQLQSLNDPDSRVMGISLLGPSSDFERYNGEFGSNTQNGIRLFNKLQYKLVNLEAHKIKAEARNKDKEFESYAMAEATDLDLDRTWLYRAGAGAGVAIVDGDDRALELKANANAELGFGGAIAEAGVDAALYRKQTKTHSMSFGGASVGGGVGVGPGGVKASVGAQVDLVHTTVKLDDDVTFDASLGLNGSTGVDIGPAGISLSFLGLGVSVGTTTGFSTPFGGISVSLLK